ncbi:MAG: transposase [Desulfobacteraceae bacterium]|nr:transposase [Desulfobacteraceae bacterium]
MASKENRRITTKTVRSMLGLAHYKFKETMRWMCRKYGKTLVDVNEAYTSKTMSWCGKIKENLGGSKTISDGKIKVDRDINAARNILLKSLAAA